MKRFTEALAEAIRQCPELTNQNLIVLASPAMQVELSLELVMNGEISPDYLRRSLRSVEALQKDC